MITEMWNVYLAGREICVTFPYVERDAIRFKVFFISFLKRSTLIQKKINWKDIATDLANVDASSAFMVNFVKVVFHYLVASMVAVMCRSSVFAMLVGMDCFVVNVS